MKSTSWFTAPILSTGLVLSGLVQAQPAGQLSYPQDLQPDHANLAYANISERQVLDLFLPEGDGPFPLVLNLHGGAFRFGSKELLPAPLARALLEEGIAVASMNYRLSGEARFPAAVQDAKAAVRFLRAQAPQFNLNANSFVLFGQSAGAHIATIVAASDGEPLFEDPTLGHPGVSSRVSAVVDWYGPSDFSSMDEQAKTQGCPESSQQHSAADSPESLYLGAQITLLPLQLEQANPITYLSPGDPPFLIQKGDQDCIVPLGQSQQLYEALREAGVKAELDIFEGAGHGDPRGGEPQFLSPRNIKRVITFIQEAVGQ